MAAPAVPTLTTLTTEALKKATHSTPSAAELTWAADWMEEIKNDILVLANGRKLKSLYTVSATVTTNGKSRYSNPTDYFSDLTLVAIHGEKIGSSQAGAVGSVTLASGHGYAQADLLGKEIFIYSGTGVSSLSQCTGLSGDIASVTPNFTTAPATASGYMFVEKNIPLEPRSIWDKEKLGLYPQKGEPVYFMPTGDADYGEFELWPTPYNTTAPYGLKMRYYANLMTLDLAGTLIATLYQRWRNIWIQGVFVRALESKNDNRGPSERQKYEFMLQNLLASETYGLDLNNLQMTIAN